MDGMIGMKQKSPKIVLESQKIEGKYQIIFLSKYLFLM
jgi:hypothetical protein